MADRSTIAIPIDLTDTTAVKRCLSMLRDEIDTIHDKVDNMEVSPIKPLVLEQGDMVLAISAIQQKINEIIDALNKAHTLS